MIVRLLAVGEVKGPLDRAAAEYETRAARYWKLTVEEVSAGAPGRKVDPERVRSEEGERLVERLHPGEEVIALTREGRGMSSRDLAQHLQEQAVRATPGVAFVIGGAFGLSDAVLMKAQHKLSLGMATLPHDLARVVLLEQIYRAGTILRNEPYHKGD